MGKKFKLLELKSSNGTHLKQTERKTRVISTCSLMNKLAHGQTPSWTPTQAELFLLFCDCLNFLGALLLITSAPLLARAWTADDEQRLYWHEHELLIMSRGTSYKDMGRKKSSTTGSTSYKVSFRINKIFFKKGFWSSSVSVCAPPPFPILCCFFRVVRHLRRFFIMYTNLVNR